MLKRILLLLAIVFILPNISFAEDPYQILDKYLEITKSNFRRDSITTLKFTLVTNATNPMTNQSMAATVKYWYKKDSSYRIEQEAMGQKTKIGFDGKSLWWTNPQQGGKLEEVPSTYRDQVLAQIIGENILGGGMSKNRDSIKLEFVAKETLDEKECFKIKILGNEDDKVAFLYFDALTGLMYQYEIDTPQGKYYRKTKQVTKSAGYFFPLKVEEWLGDKKVSDKTYQSISVNPKIDDRFFAMPANE